jgi:phage-related minor tail protein
MTQGNDTLIVDVVARLDERSFRQIQQDAERAGQRSGAGFGGGLVEGAEQGAQDAARAVQDGMQDAERAAEDGGGKAGGKLAGAFQGALAALPAMAAAAAVAVGAAAVAGVVAVTNMAAESAQNVNEFQAQLGATREEAERLGGIAEQVFGDNWTGSLTEAAAAVTDVRREIKGLAEGDLRQVTGAVVGIAETFGEENARVAAAVSSLMKATGMSAAEATDFIARGFQKGLNSSGDFLDTLTEYAPQFEKAKIGGGQLFSLLETGAAKGALGTDKIADAFKEFGLTIVDVSEDSAGVYKELGLNQEKLVKGINDGSITQAQAFELVTNKLAEVKGQADRTRIGAAIFGGAGEDFANGLTQLDLTKTSMKDLAGGVDAVNTRYNSFRDVFQGVWRQVQVALLPVGKELLGLANEAMPAVKAALSQVTPVVTQVVKFLVDGFRQGRAAGQQFADQFGPQIERALVTFRPVLQAIGPLFASVFGLVKQLWETVLRPVLTAIAPLIAGTVATIGNTLNLVVRVVTGVVNAVSALLRGDLGGAVKAVQGIFEDGVTFVVRQVRNMASTMLGLIRNLAPQMAGAAADILRGLIRGIENGAGQVVQAARNMAGGIIDGIRSKLKIQSPSKEMYILGEHTADGLTNGITAKTPAVQKAAKDMATGVITEAQKARAELEKSIKMDAWVDSLQNATTAQLKTAQATARAAGEADKYSAIKTELERREQAATAATEKATAATKAQADQLASARKAITDGLSFEAYTKGLTGYTDAQLNAAKANAYAAGDGQKFNAVLAEQKARLEAAKAAADATTQALSELNDAQIAAANSAYQRDPQGAADAAFRQSFGVGDEGLIRSLAAVTGRTIAQIRADVTGALDEAKRFAPAAAAIIERVWAANLEQRRAAAAEEVRLNDAINASYEQQSNDRIALIKKRQEEADRAVPDFAGMQRELILLDRPLDGLIALATEYAEGTDDAAVAAQNFLAGLKGLEVQARATATALGPVDALRTRGTAAPDGPVAARGTVNTTVMQADQARGALTAEAEAWRTRTEAQEYAAQAQEEYRRTLDGKTVADLESLKAQALQLGQMEKYAVLVAEITRLKKDQAEADKKAAEEAAKRAALELNGTNVSGRFEKGKTEASDKAAGTILNTVEAIGALANPATYLAFVLEKLNIVGTIFEGLLSVIAEPLKALQEPLRLFGELVGALMVPNLQLLAAVLTPLMRVLVAVYDALAQLLKNITFGLVDITRDKYKQGSASLTPAPAAPSTTTPATASGNNVVQIPTSQVTVMAAPEWEARFGGHVDRFGGYVQTLVTQGFLIRTEPSSNTGGGGAPPALLSILTP